MRLINLITKPMKGLEIIMPFVNGAAFRICDQ